MNTVSWQDKVWRNKVAKKKQRAHRPCKKHGNTREVCNDCGLVVCTKCKHSCTPKRIPDIEVEPVRKRRKADTPLLPRRRANDPTGPVPDKALNPVWQIVEALGAVGIESHVDSGAWAFVFPPHHWGMNAAGEVADKLWTNAALRLLAEPTAFRAGRWQKPERWWVSFQVRK